MTTRGRLPATTRMGVVNLRVSNLTEVLAFYTDGVGLELLSTFDGVVTLGLRTGGGSDLAVPVITLTHTPELGLPSPGDAGLFHTAILFNDPGELARSVYSLARRYPRLFQGASDHLVSRAFYFSDPEGNGVELYVDRPRDEWTWEGSLVQMSTLPLDPQVFLHENLPNDDYESEGSPTGLSGTIGHVHLQVGDTDTAREFYVDALGFDETARYGHHAVFVAAGGYHHHMAMNTWNSRGAGPRATTLGLDQVEIFVPHPDDLDAVATRLRTHGVAIDDEGSAILVRDPWKNTLRLSVDETRVPVRT